MNKTTIDQAINQINNAKNALHGANKLQQAKMKLIKLSIN